MAGVVRRRVSRSSEIGAYVVVAAASPKAPDASTAARVSAALASFLVGRGWVLSVALVSFRSAALSVRVFIYQFILNSCVSICISIILSVKLINEVHTLI